MSAVQCDNLTLLAQSTSILSFSLKENEPMSLLSFVGYQKTDVRYSQTRKPGLILAAELTPLKALNVLNGSTD